MPLTGGYRRIPILQEGADLWCDTRLIAQELERRVPSPTLFPDGTRGHGEAIAWWAEHQFMRPTALFVSGINADHMPEGLHEDRARLHGLPPPSIEAVRAAAERNRHLVRPQIKWLAEMLARRPAVPPGRPRPASPTSPPITSSGSIAAATSTAAPSSIPIRSSSPGATAWPRSATASAPR